jgi:P27 family predicted phage terminase small subunit
MTGRRIVEVCEAYARVRALGEILATEGEVVTTKSGSKPHPLLSSRTSANRQLLQGLNELGLTPSGRKRLRMEWPAEEKPEDDLFDKWASDRRAKTVDEPADPRQMLREQPDPRLHRLPKEEQEAEMEAYVKYLDAETKRGDVAD